MAQNKEEFEKALQSVTNMMRGRGFTVEIKAVAHPNPAVKVVIEVSKKEIDAVAAGVVEKSTRIEKA